MRHRPYTSERCQFAKHWRVSDIKAAKKYVSAFQVSSDKLSALAMLSAILALPIWGVSVRLVVLYPKLGATFLKMPSELKRQGGDQVIGVLLLPYLCYGKKGSGLQRGAHMLKLVKSWRNSNTDSALTFVRKLGIPMIGL